MRSFHLPISSRRRPVFPLQPHTPASHQRRPDPCARSAPISRRSELTSCCSSRTEASPCCSTRGTPPPPPPLRCSSRCCSLISAMPLRALRSPRLESRAVLRALRCALRAVSWCLRALSSLGRVCVFISACVSVCVTVRAATVSERPKSGITTLSFLTHDCISLILDESSVF